MPPRLCLLQLYGTVLPFVEMGHTLGRVDLRFEFGGPLTRGKVIQVPGYVGPALGSCHPQHHEGHEVTQVAF